MANVRLTDRDKLILRFILEQKFASLEHIYFGFFDRRTDASDPLPTNLWTTRQRLHKLASAGLIKSERVLSSSRAQYLITGKAKKYLMEVVYTRPPKIREAIRIDFSLYEHDRRVAMIRAILAAKNKYKEFYSEKILRSNIVETAGGAWRFSKELIPDGVFITVSGACVALEFELNRKSIRRIEDKIYDYEKYLGNTYEKKKIIDKVWVVAANESILKVYRRAIEKLADDKNQYGLNLYSQVIDGQV